jgi:hypothetical protein
MRSDSTLLLDMLIAARRIKEFASDLTWESFQQSKLHQSAIVREIQVMGEAARQISETTKTEHSESNGQKLRECETESSINIFVLISTSFGMLFKMTLMNSLNKLPRLFPHNMTSNDRRA